MMKLYASAASSFARKVRVMLLEKGIEHELELVNLWEANKLHDVNPLGKVPALQLEDGRVLISSPLLADFIDGRYPTPRFIPEDFEARTEVRRWEALVDGSMDAVSATLTRCAFTMRQNAAKRGWSVKEKNSMADSGRLNRCSALAGGVGDKMTLADISVACHLGFINLRVPQYFPPDEYPGLSRLWRSMEERDSFKKTAPPRS